MKIPSDLITITQARALLGVSDRKMSQLLSEGVLPYYTSPLDKRVKLVSRAAVEQLKEARAA